MRVQVVGSSGAGKSSFAQRLALRIGASHIELDALNWGPHWTNLSLTDPEVLRARVRQAIAGEHWTICGNYSVVRPIVMARATHLVWLDFARPVVMARVIRRSFIRAMTRAELWEGSGNRETFSRWLDKGHPIRWAWDTFHDRRAAYEKLFVSSDVAHLEMHRLRLPHDTAPLIDRLAGQGAAGFTI